MTLLKDPTRFSLCIELTAQTHISDCSRSAVLSDSKQVPRAAAATPSLSTPPNTTTSTTAIAATSSSTTHPQVNRTTTTLTTPTAGSVLALDLGYSGTHRETQTTHRTSLYLLSWWG